MRNRLLLCAVLLLSLNACRGNHKKVIAVIPKGTSHLFWVSVQAGALAAGEKYGVDVEWNGPAQETEYDRQIQIVDSMISRRVDGLAVAATERKALVRSIDRATELGIPVTVFDSGVDTDKYLTFIATDNYAAGKMAAHELARLLNNKGTIVVVMNAPGSASTMDRERGFDDVMRAEYPHIEIVARQYGLSDRSKAMTVTENFLTAHPGLNGIFASSEPSSVGASLALKSRNLAGKVKFVAFDASDTMIEDLKNGVIDAMVVQDPFKMGFEAVETLVQKLQGQTPPKKMDLPAHLVRREDLNQPDVHALLYPDVKKYIK